MAQAAGCHELAICCGNLLKPASRLTSERVQSTGQSGRSCVGFLVEEEEEEGEEAEEQGC